MRKIASTTELQHQLRRILTYAESDRPSRERIASALEDIRQGLMRKVGAATLMDLKDRLYNTPVRLKGYNIRPTVTSAHGADAGKVLIQLAPEMTRSQHASLARDFKALGEKLDEQWSEVADEAAQATWGRDFQVTDYRVSAIGSDEFAPEYKEKLRELGQGASKAKVIAAAHEAASKSRMLKK